MKHFYVTAVAVLLALPTYAEDWVADPDKSRLTFTALQQGMEFEGMFNKFSASFKFDPANPDGGSINARINLASVNTEMEARDEYLVQEEWFHVDIWPQASYIAEEFRHVGEDQYVADGMLTLRDVSKVTQLMFTLKFDDSKKTAVMVGSASLNRLDFGVGHGDWEDTSWVGAPVKITIELKLLRSLENQE